MTRLSDALDRAGMERQTPPQTADATKTNEDVLRTWHLDDVPAPAADADAAMPPDTPASESLRLFSGGAPALDAVTTPPRAVANGRTFRVSAELAGKIVVGDDSDPIVVEQYRRLAAVLHHAQVQRKVRSVMIASGAAAEGKTLAATNLALTLAESFDRRVLLIDGDLRQPRLHDLFCLPNDRGLLETLRRPESGRLPVHGVTKRLWVLTAGRPTADPMSGLISDSMKQLVTDAVEQFDWVIVDTPPVALMPDAKLLASLVDGALLVVRAHATPYSVVQRAVAAIGQERIFGVVLNRADHAEHRDYGYYGYTYDRARGGARRGTEAIGSSPARG